MKISLSLVFTLFVITSYSQAPGNCPADAALISECGITYTGNNSSYDNKCGGDKCGCVGGGSNPSNFDNDCATVYPGGNCGSDFAGSIENSMWWYFTPVEDCDYVITVTPYNCCCAQGSSPDIMQVWVGQIDNGSVNSYLVNDGANTSLCCNNTVTYTVPVNTSDGSVYIMLDGHSGTECDVDITIAPSNNCINTCPILLDNNYLKYFDVKLDGCSTIITMEVVSNDVSFWELQVSNDGITWNTFGLKRSYRGNTLQWVDAINKGQVYYRVNDSYVFSQIKTIRNYCRLESDFIIRRYSILGEELSDEEFELYRGFYIEVYDNKNSRILNK